MRAFLKSISLLLGLAAISIVVWLGFRTVSNQSAQLVAIFGLASALVAPLGFVLIGYAFRSNDQEVINRLAKVPEIEKLIIEAKSQEEKIRLLEKQKQQLTDIVLVEARRQSLITRKEALQTEAVRTLEELRAIDAELSSLSVSIKDNKEIAEELNALQERIEARRRGDIIFWIRRRSYVLEAGIIRSLPWGELVYDFLRLISRSTEWATSEMRRARERPNVGDND